MGKITLRAAKILANRVYEKIKEKESKEESFPNCVQKLSNLDKNIRDEISKLNVKLSKIQKSLNDKGYYLKYNYNTSKYTWCKKQKNLNNNLLTKIEEDIILESEFNSASLEELENALVKKYS